VRHWKAEIAFGEERPATALGLAFCGIAEKHLCFNFENPKECLNVHREVAPCIGNASKSQKATERYNEASKCGDESGIDFVPPPVLVEGDILNIV